MSICDFVLVGVGSLGCGGFFLALGAGEVHSGAVVVFWQAVFTAELVSAVGTPERKKRFLPAFPAFHTLPTHVVYGKSGDAVYIFPFEIGSFLRLALLVNA